MTEENCSKLKPVPPDWLLVCKPIPNLKSDVMLKKFKVASVSRNPDSSGVYWVIIIAEDGECYQIAVSGLHKPSIGQELSGMMSKSGIVLMYILGIHYESPTKMQDAPAEIVNLLFHQSQQRAVA